jgi:hypothetical protein
MFTRRASPRSAAMCGVTVSGAAGQFLRPGAYQTDGLCALVLLVNCRIAIVG